MAGKDRSIEEVVKSAVQFEERLAALERRATDVEGRVTMIGTDTDDRLVTLEAGFEALVRRAELLGWHSFLRDLKEAGFDVGERPVGRES